MIDIRDRVMRLARTKGARARRAGEGLSANPYWDEVLRMCWSLGWREASPKEGDDE